MLDSTLKDEQECKELQMRYTLLKKELALVNQQLFDNENQYTTAKERETHYLQEIELLRVKGATEVKEQENKIKQINALMAKEVTEECAALDKEIEQLRDECASLGQPEVDESPIGNLEEVQEDQDLINLIHNLQNDYVNKDLEREKLQLQNVHIKNTFNNVQNEFEQLQQTFKNTKEKILEAESVLNNLEAELILTKSDLTCTKQILQPVNEGGSLFAEVNDRRVELRKNMEDMKSKCCYIKNVSGLVQKKLASLKVLSEELSTYKKMYEAEYNKNMDTLGEAYMSRIHTLQYIAKEYMSEVHKMPDPVEFGPNTIELLNNLEKQKGSSIAAIKNKTATQFRALKMMQTQLKEVEMENADIKRMISYHLNPKLQDLKRKLQSPFSNANKEVSKISDGKHNCEKVFNLEEQNVEEAVPKLSKTRSQPRKVMFTEDTAEPKSNTSKHRGKTIKLKAMDISSLIKK